ncbi:manganese efflux pump MntP family protein [Sporolactobacillus sp. THM19-2]|uniref:manganese efflux pump MntP n=1 Tax=Sporolactobacillus sp. THM19-2 TaxID=2511171 RepID=UPI00101F1ADB|nr:manganese efflux pump MntP family protein [Sporolactobacillus sp. THM19-2]RYL94009.1 manganese efflux pump [Sporolactobacillus sp. THM19-2]
MVEQLIGQGFAILMMALALGMDAFSVCMGMGMTDSRLRNVAKTGLWIGLFHMLMPLSGMILGHLLSDQFGEIAAIAGGILLLLIGAQMIFTVLSRKKSGRELDITSDTGMLLFSMSVSIDSFSVGLSMGLFGARGVAAILLFGVVSMIMAWTGFYLGRRTKNYFGRFGEMIGGLILLFFGLKLIFHLHL